MQIRASYMKANAVLLHDCQIVSGVAGCYQQAVCQGSALNVLSKMTEFVFEQTCVIRSPYKEKFAVPRQPGLVEDGGANCCCCRLTTRRKRFMVSAISAICG